VPVRVGARSPAADLRRRNAESAVLRCLAVLSFGALASEACAQLSGTISGVTDYRYRGVTLSDKRPAAQFGITYDAPGGAYVGVFGSTVRLAPPVGANFQFIGFAGYAARITSAVSLEVGGDYAAFTGSSEDNYGEIFVGAAIDRGNARVYYSPRYFGSGTDSWYGELNATQPLVPRVELTAHVGILRASYPVYHGPYFYGSSAKNVVDGRIGVAVDFDLGRVELAWVGISAKNAAYYIGGTSSPNTVVLTLSHSF